MEPNSSAMTIEESNGNNHLDSVNEYEHNKLQLLQLLTSNGGTPTADDDTDEFLAVAINGKHSFTVSPVYALEYARDKVYEMTVNGIAIMRRRSDSYFNATHILKIAGITKLRRARILEREIHTGVHEKVQGGYGKYQGTWIPYERAVALAQQYGVYDLLRDIFIYNVNGVDTPSKAELQGKVRTIQYNKTRTYSSLSEETANAANADDSMQSPSKKHKSNHLNGPVIDFPLFDHDINTPNPNLPFALEPIDLELYLARADVNGGTNKYDYNSLKNFISSIFINEMTDKDLTELLDLPEHELRQLDFDIAMDDSGNSALHWAATLGNVSLVRQLVQYGSNRIRGNNNGETALIRAILVKNSFESGSFAQLLDYFYPCLTILDHQGRSVLHQILLNSGIKRRSSACKYYLETLLEWIVVKGGALPGLQQLSLGRFMAEVVNVMDKNGDTCLNIAARIGNKAIVQQLLDIGADHTIANKAGLRPVDFGIDVGGGNGHFQTSTTASLLHSFNLQNSQPNAAHFQLQSSKKIMSSLQGLLLSLEKEFDDEIGTKQRMINDIHAKLRDQTAQLTELRRKLETLNESELKISELNNKIQNIDRAIEEEELSFKEQTKHLVGDFDGFQGDFDADEPFRVLEVYDQIVNCLSEKDLNGNEDELIENLKSKIDNSVLNGVQLPHSMILQARIKLYQKNESLIQEKIASLNKNLDLKEAKYKKIISLSTGIPDGKIDSMLEELIRAVESDANGGDVDIQRVNEFLNKLDG